MLITFLAFRCAFVPCLVPAGVVVTSFDEILDDFHDFLECVLISIVAVYVPWCGRLEAMLSVVGPQLYADNLKCSSVPPGSLFNMFVL